MQRFLDKSNVELQLEVDERNRELSRRQIHDQLAVNKRYVGKAYTSFGSGLSQDYSFVIGLNENGTLNAIRFYRNECGDIGVERMTTYPHLLGKPITRKKWNAEAIGIITDIRGMLGIGGFAHEQTAPPRKAKTKKTRGQSGRRQE